MGGRYSASQPGRKGNNRCYVWPTPTQVNTLEASVAKEDMVRRNIMEQYQQFGNH
jgi:hypothetical protein